MLSLLFSRVFLTIIIILISECTGSTSGAKTKRQVSLHDIVQGALNFVQPIFDTTQPLQSHFQTAKKIIRSELVRPRDAEILGLPKYSALADIPICKSNSKICKFISCTAHNFRVDEKISNLNLAAQILGDSKLRKAILNDPNILLTVCREQGLSPEQCKLFSSGFNLINKFITTIDAEVTAGKKSTSYGVKDDPYYDEGDALPVPIQPGVFQNVGSRTWSTHQSYADDPNQILPPMSQETRKPLQDFDSAPSTLRNLSRSTLARPLQVTPPTPSGLFSFPPLIFAFPTLATFAPLAPATISLPFTSNLISKKILNFLPPDWDTKLFSSNIIPLPLPLPIIKYPIEFDRMTSAESSRSKRASDYYDDVEEEDGAEKHKSTSTTNQKSGTNQNAKKTKTVEKNLMDCIKYLKE
ncbi:unnamed protein product [Thelazia callipaeda]|uniref:Uncharacterized protein n=1 Tax=Thelazia callipaeda TaxID=103827 RepID=A0A0N5CN13_THECL|nr:unnamed protein product [Thelazia callipaeda]